MARWNGHERKTTVEECLKLPINLFTRRGLVERDEPTRGDISWSRPGREDALASISFEVDPTGSEPMVWLFFRLGGDSDDSLDWQRIELDSTPCNFGGERWWFLCPSPVRDGCGGRRCGKIHFPAGEDRLSGVLSTILPCRAILQGKA